MDKKDFLLAIDELLELKPGTLKGSEKLADYESWDSLAVISVIAMADERYNVVVGSDAIAEAITVDQLADLFIKEQVAA